MKWPVLWLVAAATAVPAIAAADDLVWRFSQAFGERGRGRSELKNPIDVALAADGDVAVLDSDREAVILFSRPGKWLRTLGGKRGEGNLRLRRPSALVADSEGRFWVVDSGNHRLVVFNAEGKVLKRIGGLGSQDGRFRYPADMVLDRNRRVYVADSRNQRIQVFRSDGTFRASWDKRTGGRRDHLGVPKAVAFTDRGGEGVWVGNEGWQRLERFDLDGEWEESLDLTALQKGEIDVHAVEIELTFDRMFLSDAAGGRILVLNRRGEFMAEIAGPGGDAITPEGLAVNRRLDLFVADAAGARVLKYQAR